MDALEPRRLLSTVYASDLSFASSTNGWGPVERDMTTGDAAANDGAPIVINGTPYAKGLGVHAPSEVVFDLGGAYSRLLADAGIVDTYGNNGSVVFQVFADGAKVYESPLTTGADPARPVEVLLGGVQQVRLVTTTGPDGFAYDHAAWGGARFVSELPQPGPPPAPSDLTAAVASSSLVKLTWQDHANNELGFRVERSANGSAFAAVATLGVNARAYDDASVFPSTAYTYRVVAYNADGDSTPSAAALATTPAPPPPGNFLSDLPFVSSTNGWGPVERDMTVGDAAANDGAPIVIGGVAYAKGLGVHAPADVVFDLGGDYARFTAAVGIVDTYGNNGSVGFQVFADGTKVYDSGLVTGADEARAVDVDVTGVDELRLVTTPGPDGIAYDHGAWGDARVVTPPAPPGPPAAPSGLAAVAPSASIVKLTWQDGVGETGFRVERSTNGSAFATIATLAVNDRDYDDTGVAPSTSYAYRVVAFNYDGDSTPSATAAVTTPAPPGPAHFLSDLPFASSTNGWGPVERDLDTGGSAANDGIPIVIGGAAYAKGLGVHAPAEVEFDLGGAYVRLFADVGIVDRYGNNGSVVFQVFADGTKVYESPLLTGASSAVPIDVDIAGVSRLKLVVTPGPDGNAYDHAAWANARAELAGPPQPVAPSPPGGLTAVATSDERIRLKWRDRSNNESSFKIERSSNGVDFVEIGTVPANQTVYTDAGLDPSSTHTYRVRATNQYGDSTPSGAVAGTTLPHGAFLSDLAFASSTNGWGPVERDMTVGDAAPSDGDPIVINGVGYEKGIGVHAASEVVINLGGAYVRLVSDVGVVDTVGNSGSVVFQVYADGTKVYDSGFMTGADAARAIDLDVTGVAQLRLIVTNGGDSIAYDHAAWAGARLVYAPEAGGIPREPSSFNVAAPSSTDVLLTWHDDSAIEDGFKIERTTDGVNYTQIAVVGPKVQHYHDLSVGPMRAYGYRVRAYKGASANSAYTPVRSVTTPPTASDVVYLSDLPFVSEVNYVGPVERNTANGGPAAGDGWPIVLDGVPYAKGLGVHAYSEVTFDLGGDYARFLSDVGVDDAVLGFNQAMLIFRVYGDGVKLYDSGTMTSDAATKTADVSVVGINELKLVVLDSGDGTFNDFADWAGARLVLASPDVPLYPAAPLSALATASGNIWLTWADTSTNEEGFHILRSTNGVDFAEVDTVAANTTNFVDFTAAPRVKYTYRVVAFNAAGTSTASGGAVAITGVTYLSDLPFVSVTNGYGPVERDTDTGEHEAGDGTTITLNDVTYSKGLGVHPMQFSTQAPSEVVFDLGGQYTRFKSDIGVDDRYGIHGSVVFRVYADGVLVFESTVMTGLSPTQSIDLIMAGVQQLKLVVTNAGDGFLDDHSVWAGARLE